MQFDFIDDAKSAYPRLWSVRLSLLAALLSGLEAWFTYWVSGKPSIISLTAAVLCIASSFARIVAQPGLHRK